MSQGGAAECNERMVDQLVDRGLLSRGRMEAAFRAVRRDLFLPGVSLDRVYEADDAILTRRSATGVALSSSSSPAIMALMLEALDVRPGDRVLEVGAGTGYNAAVLAHLAGQAGAVTSVDLTPDVAAEARSHLVAAGFRHVDVRAGDGWLGAPDRAPFDRVIATVGVADLSPAWTAQLTGDGRIVVPLWLQPDVELAGAFVPTPPTLTARHVTRCRFMQLRGEHGEAGAAAARLAGLAGAPADRLEIEAVPVGVPMPSTRAAISWTIERPAHTFVVRVV